MDEAEWQTRKKRIDTKLRSSRGGAAKAIRVFGELNSLVAQLNEAVAA